MKSMKLRHVILFLLMVVFVTPVRASIHTGYTLSIKGQSKGQV